MHVFEYNIFSSLHTGRVCRWVPTESILEYREDWSPGIPRLTQTVEYAIAHPQLCVDDGDRFWQDLAKPGVTYVVGGCDPRMQRKMYKDALAAVGADFDKQIIPLDLRNMETPEAMKKVTEAFQRLSNP